MARGGKPIVILNDHGTNFVGAATKIKELYARLRKDETKDQIADFCSVQNIQWRYTPEHAPHFGILQEAAAKSFKYHFRWIVGGIWLTFQDLTTVSTQIDACLNSRPLTPLSHSEDGIEALTPGHFLVEAPLEASPDTESSASSVSLLQHWRLCHARVQHLW